MNRRWQPNSLSSQFGNRVRVRRILLNKSQYAIGEAAGVHPTYVSQIESGERNPSLTTIVGMAEALEVDPGELLRDLRSILHGLTEGVESRFGVSD